MRACRSAVIAFSVVAAVAGSAARHGSAAADDDAGVAPAPDDTPRAPTVHLEGWPQAEPSEKPKPQAWPEAPDVPLTRSGGAGTRCTAKRIREWLRVTCQPKDRWTEIMSVRVLGGSTDGVEILDGDPPAKEEARGIHVVMPVRPGDRRLLQLASAEFEFKAYTPDEILFAAISELWLPGAPGPTIVVD